MFYHYDYLFCCEGSFLLRGILIVITFVVRAAFYYEGRTRRFKNLNATGLETRKGDGYIGTWRKRIKAKTS
jgi:hypothetical protein